MTNSEFKQHLQDKLDTLLKLEFDDRPADYASQKDMLNSAIKIMTYGTGQERRAFRRDYERRLSHARS